MRLASIGLFVVVAACGGGSTHPPAAPDAPGLAGDGGADAAPGDAPTLPAGRKLYALMGSRSGAEIEVFALDPTPHLVTTVDLRQIAVTAFAVSADGAHAYVAATDQLVTADMATGALATASVPGAVDVALAPDGATVWVATVDSILALDPASGATRHSYAAPNINGIAASHDGAWVGGAAYNTLQMLDVANGTVTHVALHTSGTSNCGIEASDVTFTPTYAALWDPNCDEMYVVDLAQQAQTADIVFGRDTGTRYSHDYIAFSSLSNDAYAWHETEQVAISDLSPSDATHEIATGKPGGLVAITAMPDGSQLFVGVHHYEAPYTPDTIALLNPVSQTLGDTFITTANGGVGIVDLAATQ